MSKAFSLCCRMHPAALIRMVVAVMAFTLCAVQMKAADGTTGGWEFRKVGKPAYSGGDGTRNNPYLISTAQDLADLMYSTTVEKVSTANKYYRMTQDIVMNERVVEGNRDPNGMFTLVLNRKHFDQLKKCIPIGHGDQFTGRVFMGNFDGDGHSISGVVISDYFGDKRFLKYSLGLFGYCDGATIKNLTVKDSYVGAYEPESCGIIAGVAGMTNITNCHVEDSFIEIFGGFRRKGNSCGGVVGYIKAQSAVKDCSFDGTIYQNNVLNTDYCGYMIGGVVGESYMTVKPVKLENCKASGEMLVNFDGNGHDKETYMGGILGYADFFYRESERKQYTEDTRMRVTGCQNWMDMTYRNTKEGNSCNQKAKVFMAGITSGYSYCYGDANFGKISASIDDFKKCSIYQAGILASKYYTYSYECGQDDNIMRITTRDCANYGNFELNDNSEGKSAECQIAPIVDLLYGASHVEHVLAKCSITTNRTDSRMNVAQAICNPNDEYGKESQLTGAVCVTYNGKAMGGQKGAVERPAEAFYTKELKDWINADARYGAFGYLNTWHSGYNKILVPVKCGSIFVELDGDGTKDNPYLIHNEDELKYVQSQMPMLEEFRRSHIKLMANINMHKNEMNSIGTELLPFEGVFDGNGHYIQSLGVAEGSLFGYIKGGTVENLTMRDVFFSNNKVSSFAGIAHVVEGTAEKKGVIKNCVVEGEFGIDYYSIKYGSYDDDGNQSKHESYETFNNVKGSFVGGIAACVGDNAEVTECLVKGTLGLTRRENGEYPLHFGGIAGYSRGSVNNCGVSLDYTENAENPDNFSRGSIVGFQAVNQSQGNNKGNVCRTSGIYERGGEEFSVDRYDSETAFGKALQKKSGWMKTAQYALPENTYCYDATTADGTAVHLARFDFSTDMPEDNNIYRIHQRDDQKDDEDIWGVPNTVTYSDDFGADILATCYLVDGKPLRYSPLKEGVKVYGAAAYEVKPNATGWHSLCLPGSVNRGMLPENSKLYVCGPTNGTNMMVVEMDTIPAGVPFIAYIPTKNSEGKDQTAELCMYGLLEMTPQKAAADSKMTGTFQQLNDVKVCSEVSADGKTLSPSTTVEPFRGYVASAQSVNLIERLMFEEHDGNIPEVIKQNMGYPVNLAVHRDMKANEWTPVCLPFSMTKKEIADCFGADAKLETFKGMDYDAATGILNMNFAPLADNLIEAGKPYLLKPSVNVTGFALNSRTLVNTPKESAAYSINIDGRQGKVSFVGSFGRQLLVSTSEENLYYILNQKSPVKASTETPYQMNGFRCWFRATDMEGVLPFALGTARIIHEGNAYTIEDDGKTDIPVEAYGTYASGKLKYHRTLEAGTKFCTLALPFDITKKDLDACCDMIYKIKRVYMSEEKHYKLVFESLDDLKPTDIISHNDGYLVKLKDGVVDMQFANSSVVDITKNYLYASRVKTVAITDKNGNAVTSAPLCISFAPSMRTLSDNSYWYYTFNANGSFNHTGEVPPFRLYFYLSHPDGLPYLEQSNAKFNAYTDDETAIHDIKAPQSPSSDLIFTLDGKYIGKAKSAASLAKGIYIKGGKKIVVK